MKEAGLANSTEKGSMRTLHVLHNWCTSHDISEGEQHKFLRKALKKKEMGEEEKNKEDKKRKSLL